MKLLVPILLFPIAEEIYREFFHSVKAGLVVEGSHQGQFYRLLRMQVDLPAGLRSFCKSGANPFSPSEVARELRHAMMALQSGKADSLQPQE